MDKGRAQGHEAGEKNSAPARIGRGLRIGNHKKREEKKGAVLEPVQGNRHRLAQPEGTPKEEGQIAGEKGVCDIASGGAVNHQPTEAGQQKAEEGGAAPLPRRDPQAARTEHRRRNADVCGIKKMLAPPTQEKLARDGDDNGHGGEDRRVELHQQQKRKGGDERAPRVEARQPPQFGAEVLRRQRERDEADDSNNRDFKVKPSHAIKEQGRENGDLIKPGIDASGLRGGTLFLSLLHTLLLC